MRTQRPSIAAGITLALLAACGGGELLALLPYVAAIGGSWQVAGNNAERMQFNEFPIYGPGPYALTGSYTTTAKPACGAAGGATAQITAKLDGNALSLFAAGNTTTPCLTGQSSNVTTLTLSNGLTYRNDFNPDLAQGMWVDVSDARNSYRFTFNGQQAIGNLTVLRGCTKGSNVSSAATTVSYGSSDIAVVPEVEASVPELFIVRAGQPERWTNGKFLGVSLIEFKTPTATLQLERRLDDAAATPCV